jgi:predicted transcriptional regulator
MPERSTLAPSSVFLDTDDVYITLVCDGDAEVPVPKEAVFTMKLEPELREAFMAEAAGEDRPASQVVRELMRSYVEQRRQAREYEDYLNRKVEAGRASMRAGRGRPNDEVEATFGVKRKQVSSGRA